MDCVQNEPIVGHNSHNTHNSSIFDNSFKFRQKLIKKSKTALNSQLMRAESSKGVNHCNKELFNQLIGIKKPEPEVDEIDGIRFQSFETEESINLFSKFEQLEREQKEQSSLSKSFGIKSLKSGKLIFPTKTKDITKIKGWRERLFSSIDDKHNRRPIGLSNNSNKVHFNDKSGRSLISNPSIGQSSSSGSNSAFVSDLLDGYLKTKSDLKFKYMSPDFAPPPDDSPIFSASVLKMPDFGPDPMPPPFTPSTSHTFSKKKSIFKTKGLKSKYLESTPTDSQESGADDEMREALLPQYPVIHDTLWPERPMSDDQLSQLYDDYIEFTYNEMQNMKRPSIPSLVMDDSYARFTLSALQYNPKMPDITDTDSSPEDVLMAVGLTPKEKSPSPSTETKIKGRHKKDREADLTKMITMGNRSKREIRLPSRFLESSLLMGNQWIIPNLDQKGKTGKRRLQEEQRRLQQLHQKQLEMDQNNKKPPLLTMEANTTCDDSQLSLIHKRLSNGTKSKLNSLNIPSVSTEYALKIPHQRLKQIQLIRDQKKQMKIIGKQRADTHKLDKSFTSLYSMSTQSTGGDKRVLSLSAKAAASANQRAQVNQLFLQLSQVIHPDQNSMICRNGKLNKLETIKDAIETVGKLAKREQQLSYIKKLLQMWNHKLQLCHKVVQKDPKPEAYKVVGDVMNTYRNSMCYKVGEALEAKRKELHQQKRTHPLTQQNVSQTNGSNKKPQLSTSSQVLTIPKAKTQNSFKKPTKAPKLTNQRLILPKLPVLSKTPKTLKPKPRESVGGPPILYPMLTTPDLHHKSVVDSSFDSELIGRETSLLKPPILTTRPPVLKPFSVSSNEDLRTSTSVTGPVINYPNISKIKSMNKSLNISSSSSLIAPKPSASSSMGCATSSNVSTHFKLPFNSIRVPTTVMPTASIASSSQSTTPNHYNPHPYTGKNVIITSETPLANEELNRIVASISTNPDFKKVRLSNGRAGLTIPSSSSVTSPSKSSISSTPTITLSSPALIRRRNSFESKDDSKSQKCHKSQASKSSLNLSQTTIARSNSSPKKTSVTDRVLSSQLESNDCIEID